MAETALQPEARRVSAACQFCRYSKLKCSGTQPCDRCQKRSQECVYEEKDERPGVEIRSSRPRKRARIESSQHPTNSETTEQDRHSSTPAPNAPNVSIADPVDGSSSSPRFLRNRPDKQRRRWLYLGASSTWTFNVRVASLIRAHLKIEQDERAHQFTLDGDAYSMSLKKSSSDTQPDLSHLPSLDYAIYLVNTVKFHLGDILRLFDEEVFLEHLHELYSDGPEKVGTHRLWYTQCLLLLALGKGFLNARKLPENASSANFFSRALSILPDVFALHEEPILAVEVLSTIALYFYCIDMRQSAYSYIGQALRIALVEGMHVDLPASQLGEKFAERCRKLWWTVYILDRTLSSAVGAPVSVHDDHIHQPLRNPRQSSQRDATLIMHVKLCRIVSDILTELYTAEGTLEHSYLSKTRSVLRRMAEIAKELEDVINFKFRSSLETLSKGALYLRLLYNQCMMLATRPLLLSLLQKTIRSMSNNNRSRIDIPSSIRDLLQTCIDSAIKTLKTLWALNDHNLLDTFLPFNLEFACSAASILIVTDDILRGIKVSVCAKSLIFNVLTEIASGGNKAAPLRQKELQNLSRLGEQLWAVTSNTSLSSVPGQRSSLLESSPQTGRLINCESTTQPSAQAAHNAFLSTHLNDEPTAPPLSVSSSTDFARTFDFSEEQMLFLADHLDSDAMSSMLDFDSHGLNEWF